MNESILVSDPFVTLKNSDARDVVRALDHSQTRVKTEIERIGISALGRGCVGERGMPMLVVCGFKFYIK